MVTYIILGIIVVALYLIMIHNKIVALKEAAITDQKVIGIQLDERGKLFDSLIATVNKYMSHESSVLENIVKLRTNIVENKNMTENEVMDNQNELSKLISSGQLKSGINMTMEAYPDLKASSNMLQLQEAIETIERRLGAAKKAFNVSVEDFEAYTKSFPANLVYAKFDSLKISLIRWELSEEKIKEEEEKRVSF